MGRSEATRGGRGGGKECRKRNEAMNGSKAEWREGSYLFINGFSWGSYELDGGCESQMMKPF